MTLRLKSLETAHSCNSRLCNHDSGGGEVATHKVTASESAAQSANSSRMQGKGKHARSYHAQPRRNPNVPECSYREAPPHARNGEPLEVCKRPPRVHILLGVESNEPRLLGKESGRSREYSNLSVCSGSLGRP